MSRRDFILCKRRARNLIEGKLSLRGILVCEGLINYRVSEAAGLIMKITSPKWFLAQFNPVLKLQLYDIVTLIPMLIGVLAIQFPKDYLKETRLKGNASLIAFSQAHS